MQSQDSIAGNIQQQENEEKNIPNIVRVCHNRQNPYLMINRQAANDPDLPMDALGLWFKLMCRPDNWQIHISELMKSCNCGRDKINRMLKDLIRFGYAHKYQDKADGKRKNQFSSNIWHIFEFKISKEEVKKMFPMTENPSTENPSTENPHLLNSDNSIDRKNSDNNAPHEGDAKPSTSSSFGEEKKAPKTMKTSQLQEHCAHHPQAAAFRQSFNLPLVGISEENHNELLAKYGAENTIKFYAYLAEWKLSKAQASPKDVKKHSDIYRIKKWVIKEVMENQNAMSGSYKRTGKLAIQADKTAMTKLQESGTHYVDAEEFGKKILEKEPTLVDDYFKKYHPQDKETQGDK